MTRHLLLIDSRAGLLVGAFMLLLSGFLSQLYGLPRTLLLVMGAANIVYGTYSGWLARQPRRPYGLLVALVVANATWAVLCVAAAWRFRESASALGLASLLGEGLFVGGLAALEWRAREQLRSRA